MSMSKVHELHRKSFWLHSAGLCPTPGACKVHVCNGVPFDAIVAEHMTAAYGVRHCGPLAAQPALFAVGRLWGVGAGGGGGVRRWEEGEHCGLELPHVDQRQQEDEELGEAVPQQLAVDVVEWDVARRHLRPAELRAHPQRPLCQRWVGATPEELQEIEEACGPDEPGEDLQRSPGRARVRVGGESPEERVRALPQPALSDRAQRHAQLLPAAHGPVAPRSGGGVSVADAKQRLARRGALGVDGEAPQQQLEQRFELRLKRG